MKQVSVKYRTLASSAKFFPRCAKFSPRSAKFSPRSARFSPRNAEFSPRNAEFSPRSARFSSRGASRPREEMSAGRSAVRCSVHGVSVRSAPSLLHRVTYLPWLPPLCKDRNDERFQVSLTRPPQVSQSFGVLRPVKNYGDIRAIPDHGT